MFNEPPDMGVSPIISNALKAHDEQRTRIRAANAAVWDAEEVADAIRTRGTPVHVYYMEGKTHVSISEQHGIRNFGLALRMFAERGWRRSKYNRKLHTAEGMIWLYLNNANKLWAGKIDLTTTLKTANIPVEGACVMVPVGEHVVKDYKLVCS